MKNAVENISSRMDQIEKVCEIEDGAFEIIQSEDDRE